MPESWFFGGFFRDMKERMAGPGDKYAKETRKYNPEFAADHPDEDYDAKVNEVGYTQLATFYFYFIGCIG